jgi:hypothetical protein
MSLQTNSPQEATIMFSTRTRTLIATLITAGSFATATIAPAVSQARPVKLGRAEIDCPVAVSNGETVYLPEGSVVTTYGGGRLTCKNGYWQPLAVHVESKTSITVKSVPVASKLG